MYTLTLARFHEVGSREVEVEAYVHIYYTHIHISIYVHYIINNLLANN